MNEPLTLKLDDHTTVEKNGGVFTIRQLDYFKEKEKCVFLTIDNLEEIISLTNLMD